MTFSDLKPGMIIGNKNFWEAKKELVEILKIENHNVDSARIVIKHRYLITNGAYIVDDQLDTVAVRRDEPIDEGAVFLTEEEKALLALAKI